MISYRIIPQTVLAISLLLVGCNKVEKPDAGVVSVKDSPIAVSSPYLEAALRELLPRETPVVRLAGPSMCPGHFDMRPSQVSQLAGCGLLVRFDFQQDLDRRLAAKNAAPGQTAAIAVRSGLCVPETYVSACRQLAGHLVRLNLLRRAEADVRLRQLAVRMASLKREVDRQTVAGRLRDTPVLASGHQADFCRWLGLRIVAETSGADGCGIRDLDEAFKAGQAANTRLVIANEPEGRRAADALADRLHAKVVVFANFPDPDKTLAFDDLVRRNVAAILAIRPSNDKKP